MSKLAAERFLLALAIDSFDVRVLRLPLVYGDVDALIAEAIPTMRGFSPTRGMWIVHHADVNRAVARLPDGRRIREDLGFRPKSPAWPTRWPRVPSRTVRLPKSPVTRGILNAR